MSLVFLFLKIIFAYCFYINTKVSLKWTHLKKMDSFCISTFYFINSYRVNLNFLAYSSMSFKICIDLLKTTSLHYPKNSVHRHNVPLFKHLATTDLFPNISVLFLRYCINRITRQVS